MIITAYNPDTKFLERTFLSADHNEGVSDLNVKNNDRFAASQRVLIGGIGTERSEIATTDGVTPEEAVSLTGPTKFAHNADDPLYVLEYDQIEFHRANSENGAYVLVQTVAIDTDNFGKTTDYDDTSGTSSHWYKIRYKNSVTNAVSEFADPVQATGYPVAAIGAAIDAHVRRVRDTKYTIYTPDEYLDMANEVNDDLLTQSHKPYRFQKQTVLLDTVAGQDYIELSSIDTEQNLEFWKFDYLVYTVTTAGVPRTYKIENPLSLEAWIKKYKNVQWMDSDELLDIAIDEANNRIMLGPASKTTVVGAVELHYYGKLPVFDSIGDRVYTPNTLIYKYKFRAEYYTAKAEDEPNWLRLATKYEDKYGAEIVKMQRANRVDVGTPRSFTPARIPGYRRRYHL